MLDLMEGFTIGKSVCMSIKMFKLIKPPGEESTKCKLGAWPSVDQLLLASVTGH